MTTDQPTPGSRPGDSDFELIESFDIDDNQLDGIRPQVVFSLGVEWEMVRQELDTGREVNRTIHVENTERFRAMCFRRGREAIIAAYEGLEGQWVFMKVEAM